MPIIYMATNKTNSKKYVGLSRNTLAERKAKHVKDAFSLYRQGPFQKALIKYGVDGFDWEVLETCDSNCLEERETFWIKHFQTMIDDHKGYNVILDAKNHAREWAERRKNNYMGSNKLENKEDFVYSDSRTFVGDSVESRPIVKNNQYRQNNGVGYLYKITDPSGKVFLENNLMRFCRHNKLNNSDMYKVVNGQRISVKGYSVERFVKQEVRQN